MKCKCCGAEVKDNFKFCGKCGARVEAEMPPVEPLNTPTTDESNDSPDVTADEMIYGIADENTNDTPDENFVSVPHDNDISEQYVDQKPQKKGNGAKIALIIIICVLVVALLAGVGFFFGGEIISEVKDIIADKFGFTETDPDFDRDEAMDTYKGLCSELLTAEDDLFSVLEKADELADDTDKRDVSDSSLLDVLNYCIKKTEEYEKYSKPKSVSDEKLEKETDSVNKRIKTVKELRSSLETAMTDVEENVKSTLLDKAEDIELSTITYDCKWKTKSGYAMESQLTMTPWIPDNMKYAVKKGLLIFDCDEYAPEDWMFGLEKGDDDYYSRRPESGSAQPDFGADLDGFYYSFGKLEVYNTDGKMSTGEGEKISIAVCWGGARSTDGKTYVLTQKLDDSGEVNLGGAVCDVKLNNGYAEVCFIAAHAAKDDKSYKGIVENGGFIIVPDSTDLGITDMVSSKNELSAWCDKNGYDAVFPGIYQSTNAGIYKHSTKSSKPAETTTKAEETTATPAAGKTMYVSTDAGLRMRAGPGTNYDIVCEMPYKSEITVYEYNTAKTWAKISYKGKNGWCSAEYISEKKP